MAKRSKKSQEDVPQMETDRWGDTEMYGNKEAGAGAFDALQTGAPEQARIPGDRNPQAVQGGLGPLGLQGQGDRQNDSLAELQQVEPNLDLDEPDQR